MYGVIKLLFSWVFTGKPPHTFFQHVAQEKNRIIISKARSKKYLSWKAQDYTEMISDNFRNSIIHKRKIDKRSLLKIEWFISQCQKNFDFTALRSCTTSLHSNGQFVLCFMLQNFFCTMHKSLVVCKYL